jgi:hypothetical protein
VSDDKDEDFGVSGVRVLNCRIDAGRIDLRSLVATKPIVAEIIFDGESPDIVSVRE